VNLGLPSDFFTPVLRLSELPEVYSLQGLEYGVGLSVWPLERLQAQLTLPFESNSFTDITDISHSSVRPGDLKLGASWLGWGTRTGKIRVAANGWAILPSGVSPFRAVTPILATGLGTYRAALGVWASEQVGRFSFFQWINYEKSTSTEFNQFADTVVPGSTLYWPDRQYAGARIEWRFFNRGIREASLVGSLRVQRWGDWKVNDFVWSPADRIFDAGLGLKVRADKELTVEGLWNYFPVEWNYSITRPDFGQIITLVLCFHPFDEGKAR
jgi:hypothetical protein